MVRGVQKSPLQDIFKSISNFLLFLGGGILFNQFFDLQKSLVGIEKILGRENKGDLSPRIIDIDLLIYEDFSQKNENLIIPHPKMTERAFVMIPLAEIAPDLIIHGYNKTVKEIAGELDSSLVEIF